MPAVLVQFSEASGKSVPQRRPAGSSRRTRTVARSGPSVSALTPALKLNDSTVAVAPRATTGAFRTLVPTAMLRERLVVPVRAAVADAARSTSPSVPETASAIDLDPIRDPTVVSKLQLSSGGRQGRLGRLLTQSGDLTAFGQPPESLSFDLPYALTGQPELT